MAALHDDPSISSEEELWRRIRPDWVVFDKNLDPPRMRPKSIAFQNYKGTDTMSVMLASARESAEAAVSGHAGYFLVAFTVGLARELGQGVVEFHDPDEPGHHHVVGKKTGSARDGFAQKSNWKVAPPPDFSC